MIHKKDQRKTSVLVYTTDEGRICPACSYPMLKCVCGRPKPVRKGDGVLRIGRELNGRGGKTVTTISGFVSDELTLKGLLSDLKKLLGTGGTLKNNVMEIQGDHRETLVKELGNRGFIVKKAGG